LKAIVPKLFRETPEAFRGAGAGIFPGTSLGPTALASAGIAGRPVQARAAGAVLFCYHKLTEPSAGAGVAASGTALPQEGCLIENTSGGQGAVSGGGKQGKGEEAN